MLEALFGRPPLTGQPAWTAWPAGHLKQTPPLPSCGVWPRSRLGCMGAGWSCSALRGASVEPIWDCNTLSSYLSVYPSIYLRTYLSTGQKHVRLCLVDDCLHQLETAAEVCRLSDAPMPAAEPLPFQAPSRAASAASVEGTLPEPRSKLL